jgi:FkbM family methyltransferase
MSVMNPLERLRLSLRAHRIRRRGDPEFHWVREMLGPARRAIDCGANRGVYTYWLARYARAVEAFEPNPQLVAKLRAAGLGKVTVHEGALSDSVGEAVLHVPFHRRGGLNDPGGCLDRPDDDTPMAQFTTPLKRLDDYAFTEVDFIKVDVEGHEEKVLAGAWHTISTQQPALLLELEERHNPGCLTRVVAQLADVGYRGLFLDANRWQAVNKLADWTSQRASTGRYINNFLFVADARLG